MAPMEGSTWELFLPVFHEKKYASTELFQSGPGKRSDLDASSKHFGKIYTWFSELSFRNGTRIGGGVCVASLDFIYQMCAAVYKQLLISDITMPVELTEVDR